jgi:hypothetical protein
MLSQGFNIRVSLFTNSGHGHGHTRAFRAFKHEEGKPAVACY